LFLSQWQTKTVNRREGRDSANRLKERDRKTVLEIDLRVQTAYGTI
jgi:hypothetical protein